MRILPANGQTLPSLYLWKIPIITFFIELAIIIVSWIYYWRALKSNEEITSLNRPLVMIGLLSLIHLINFLPSFSDLAGTEANSSLGFVVIVAIIIIAGLMTWLHPNIKLDRD